MGKYLSKADDLELLLPTFRAAVKTLIELLGAEGFHPVAWDTLRTPAEAANNAAKGTGSRNSMHLYGCACDLICDEHGWACAQHKCDFFKRVGALAEPLGLTWGGRFSKGDFPHVQAIPVGQQVAMRALGSKPASADKRDALCKTWLTRVAKQRKR